MKKALMIVLAGLAAMTLVTGCKSETEKPAQAPAQTETPAAPAAAGKSGTVVESMDAAGYTYVQVDTGTEKIWAAAPQFNVKAGDAVIVPEGMPMTNYHSKTLDRDFDVVYFVDSMMVGGEQAAAGEQMPEGHPSVGAEAQPAAADVDFSGLSKAEGGVTVADAFGKKAELAGQKVSIRGKVVKFNGGILGRNWLHIQDGTGVAPANDLTVTSQEGARVGETVLVRGTLVTDQDFGSGYRYDLIVEKASITVE